MFQDQNQAYSNGNRQFLTGKNQGQPVSQQSLIDFLPAGGVQQNFPPHMQYDTSIPQTPQPQLFQGGSFSQSTPSGSFSGLSTPFTASGATKPALQRKNRMIIAIALAVFVLVVSAGGYYYLKASSAANVTLYQVNNQNVTQYIGGGGIVFPNQQIDISYPVVERVVSVFVKPGDHVSLNQPLIQLDPSQLNSQITEASNEVASAQAFLNSVSTSGNAVTIAQAQQAYDNARSRYNALVAQLSSFTLHSGKLISPLNGVVTAVNVDASEVFAADKPLITIMDESTAIVHVEVPLVSLGQVHLGQTATVTPSALPNLNLKGTVSAIIPQADPQTDTYEVWIVVPNQTDLLLPGMSAFVRIQSGGQASVVPRLAVLNPDTESIVFVVRNQYAYIQHVHVAGRSVDSMYIDSGIAPGDQIVLVGLDKIQNGQKVHITQIEKAM